MKVLTASGVYLDDHFEYGLHRLVGDTMFNGWEGNCTYMQESATIVRNKFKEVFPSIQFSHNNTHYSEILYFNFLDKEDEILFKLIVGNLHINCLDKNESH